ncbi:MAG: alpha/beta hydrolase [Lutibacter sp.]
MLNSIKVNRVFALLIIAGLFFSSFLFGQKKSSQVLKKSFYSSYLKRKVNYTIYLPINYDKETHFPIIYLLHGHGGNENSWFHSQEGNIQIILDSLIQNKKILPLVAVSMDANNSWYVNSIEKMESVYFKEFMPLIESEYKINTQEHSRTMAGLSMGGYGALRFGLLHPELFKAIILLSPAAYYPEPPLNSSSRKILVFKKDGVFNKKIWHKYSYPQIFKRTGRKDYYPKFYISSGDDDEFNISNVVVDLRNFLAKNQIPQELTIINGKHNWPVWRNRFIYDVERVFR